MAKIDSYSKNMRRGGHPLSDREVSPLSEFARVVDLSIDDAERIAQNPTDHGVNAEKAAQLVGAISAEWGDLDTFRMCNGYESFE
ncbi:MAG: hypothetical protein ACRBCT_02710 [Alphaproteobacteria bacterium]